MKINLDWGNVLGAASAGISSFLTFFFGGWDTLLIVLVTLSCVDFVTGLLAGAYEKKLNSETGYKGIIKKVSIYFVVALACMIDKGFGTEILRSAVIGFYIAMEGISILENTARVGIPYPKKLLSALEQLRDEGETNG